jgi:hypothetical protein
VDVGDESSTNPRYVIIQLKVIQYNCSVEHPKLKGGSSIEVISNGPMLDYCDVTDCFDGTYTVECRLHLLHRAHEAVSTQTQRRRLHESHLQLCTNITAYVDYEHFDAFTVAAALYHPQYPLLRHPITVDQEFCHKLHHHHHLHTILQQNITSSSSAIANATDNLRPTPLVVDLTRASEGFWVKRLHNSPDFTISTNTSATEIMADRAKHYEWQWSHDIPTVAANTNVSCLEGKNVWLIGESHMQYNWDYLTYLNFENARGKIAEQTRKHGDQNFGMFQYKRAIFAQSVAAKFDDACDKALLYKAHSILVIQPGSWDSSNWPPQMFINSPKSAASIIEGSYDILLFKISNHQFHTKGSLMHRFNFCHNILFSLRFSSTLIETGAS